MSATTTSSPPDVQETLRGVVAVADDRKATDLKVFSLGEVSDFTDYFIVCSGRTGRQVSAIAEAIRRALWDRGVRPIHIEGQRSARWVLLDYGDLVIHVFDPETREYYGLERLWSDAPDVTADLRV